MSNWIALTDADVLDEFSPAEDATLRNIQGATHKLPRICEKVAAEFRQAITDSGVDISATTDGYLPPGFIAKAAALARWRWLIAIPQARTMQTPERKAAADAAEELINAIATGERPVAAPDVAAGPGKGASLLSSDDDHPFSQLGTT